MAGEYTVKVKSLESIQREIAKVEIAIGALSESIRDDIDTVSLNEGDKLSSEQRAKAQALFRFKELVRDIMHDLTNSVVLISRECMTLHEGHDEAHRKLSDFVNEHVAIVDPLVKSHEERKTIWGFMKEIPTVVKIISAIAVVSAAITILFKG